MTEATVWFAVAWHRPPDGVPRIAADAGRLLVWATAAAAAEFADLLARRAPPTEAAAFTITPAAVRDLLGAHGFTGDDLWTHVDLVEAQTTDPADLVRWNAELASRVAVALRERNGS